MDVIKAELNEALAKRFRKRAMERYGYRKGAVKRALEDLIRRYTSRGSVNWHLLKGTIRSELSSVELQHKMWKKVD
jgi:hypothetical protein